MTATDVFLTCQVCGHQWHAAVIPDGWPEAPERIAARCFCVACVAPPPHRSEFVKRVALRLPTPALEAFVCGGR